MKIEKLGIEGLVLIEPRIFTDDRGYFCETFQDEKYKEILGQDVTFVQDNMSFSRKNVVRGLHFQSPPFAQGKLVSVPKGKVLDVAVDLRKHSSTYGEHVSVVLSGDNARQFWIPAGFAHGFSVLEDETIFTYKCSNYYSPEHENCILWDDDTLCIDWVVEQAIVSEKDQMGKLFSKFDTPF